MESIDRRLLIAIHEARVLRRNLDVIATIHVSPDVLYDPRNLDVIATIHVSPDVVDDLRKEMSSWGPTQPEGLRHTLAGIPLEVEPAWIDSRVEVHAKRVIR